MIEALEGKTCIEFRVTTGDGDAVTSREAAMLVTPSSVAVIDELPSDMPSARPELSIVATEPFELSHCAESVTSA